MKDEEKKTLEEFGKNLQRLRNEKELSLRQLAVLANMEHALIHRIEKGTVNPKLTTLLTLAKALNVNLNELLKA